MTVDEQTVVLVDGKRQKLAELKPGQWIKVTRDADWKKVLKIEPSASVWENEPATKTQKPIDKEDQGRQ